MKVREVAEYFEQIELESARLAKTRMLADLLREASEEEAEIIVNLSLGQLHPPHRGTQFNLASKAVIPVLAQLLRKTPEDVEWAAKREGDVGSLLAKGDWKSKKDLSITQVYEALCALEQISGTGSQEKKVEALSDLLRSLDPRSAKYVLRVVVGKLRLGFSDMTVVDVLSWMEVEDKSMREVIENAYNVCADLGFIAAEIKHVGAESLARMTIKVGTPVRPAAAERLPTAKDIFKKIGPCIAQPKLDGFRLQIHLDKRKKKPVVKFFSRNLQDMSHMFPDLVDVVAALDVDTLICEGEAIAYDVNTGSFLPFQETAKRKRKHDIEEVAQEFPLKVFIFDVLHLNGESLLDKTHAQRRDVLLSVVKKDETALVQPIAEVAIGSVQELEAYFTEILLRAWKAWS